MNGEEKIIRTGPHPLALHVTSSSQNWTGAAMALGLFLHGGLPLHPDLKKRADDLLRDIEGASRGKLQLAVMKAARSRLSDLLCGIRAYQQHPYERNVSPAPLSMGIGTTEIRDYGTGLSDQTPVVLAVPSLVNPAYILDLREDHSLMRTLAQQGIHGYLLDWTTPAEEEMTFGLEDYIVNRLIPLIREIHRRHHRKIHLLGYCMGGNLALAAAVILHSEDIIDSLTLIATPWDFHASQPRHLSALTAHFMALEPFTRHSDAIPMNALQMFFFSLDPTLSDRKFRKFYHLDPASDQARDFVAIEDWAGGGAPLAPKVTRDCLIDWYQKNQPENNGWTIAGTTIDPTCLTLPGQIITPRSDRIVPPASAKALVKKLPHFHHYVADGGHVTMIAGENAKTTLWPEIAKFLK